MPVGNYQGTYAAEKVVITVGSVIVTGFVDGDFISAKYLEDRYKSKAGADGEVGRSKTASKMGEIEINISSTSSANDELSAIFNLAQIGGIDPPIAFGVADLSGRSFAFASKAWIKSTPDLTLGMEISERKWVLECADLSISFGGNG